MARNVSSNAQRTAGEAPAGTAARLSRRGIPAFISQRSRKVPAWSVSVVLHVTLFVCLAAVWKPRPAGTSEVGGPVGIAVVYQSADTENYALADNSGAEDSSQSSATAAMDAALPGADAESAMIDEALAGLLPADDGVPNDVLNAGGTLGLGDGIGQLGGQTETPKVKTQVFGIEGEGNRFLYVFDRSDSMNGFGGRPLAMAKAELLKSLESLGIAHEFQIIFYNDSPLPFGGAGAPRIFRGDEVSKTAAQGFVRDVSAIGGTQHIDALRMALSMRPDVLFFLTDADFPAPSTGDLENLHDRAARSGTTIHCIQFGAGPNQGSGKWIEFLASGTQGKYRYVNVSLVP